MAKDKLIVASADVKGKLTGKSGAQILGAYRRREFIEHDLSRILKEANMRRIRDIGVFHKGKLIELL